MDPFQSRRQGLHPYTVGRESAQGNCQKQAFCADRVDHGSLHFSSMDLMNFETVKSAALDFLRLEGPGGRARRVLRQRRHGRSPERACRPTRLRVPHDNQYNRRLSLHSTSPPNISRTAERSLPGSVRWCGPRRYSWKRAVVPPESPRNSSRSRGV